MASVFRAADRRDGRHPVAVKVMHPRSSPSDRERFAREAALLAELTHPAIVRYVAHGAGEDGEPWLAMEWLSGEDLGARLARGKARPTLGESLQLGARLAEALTFLHAR